MKTTRLCVSTDVYAAENRVPDEVEAEAKKRHTQFDIGYGLEIVPRLGGFSMRVAQDPMPVRYDKIR